MNSPVNGLDVARMIVSAAGLPRCCNEEIIKSSANRKTKRATIIDNVLRKKTLQLEPVVCVAGLGGCTLMMMRKDKKAKIRWVDLTKT